MNNVKKWRSKNTYVDVDTGEILEESIVKSEYIIIKKTKKYHVYKTTGTVEYTTECRKSTCKQKSLFET